MIEVETQQKLSLPSVSYNDQTDCTQVTFHGLPVSRASSTVKTEAPYRQHAVDTTKLGQRTAIHTLPLTCPDNHEGSLDPESINKAEELLVRYGELGTLKEDIRTIKDSHGKYEGKVEFTYPLKLKIVSPSDLTLAAAADHYKKHNDKYKRDIKIAQIKSKIEMRHFIRSMVQKHHDSFQMGIILIKEEGSHVTPFILSHDKTNNKTTIVIIDSLNNHTDIEKKLLPIDGFQPIDNLKVISIGQNKEDFRQADSHSCRNDALLILKDALKIADFVSYLEKEGQLRPTPFCSHKPLYNPGFDYFTGPLPPFMGKTVQTKCLISRFKELINPQPLPPALRVDIKGLPSVSKDSRGLTQQEAANLKADVEQKRYLVSGESTDSDSGIPMKRLRDRDVSLMSTLRADINKHFSRNFHIPNSRNDQLALWVNGYMTLPKWKSLPALKALPNKENPLMSTLRPPATGEFNEGKAKTLQDHLKKYTYNVQARKIRYATRPEDQEWEVNLYLQIKGFYIVLHAFAQLKDAQDCIDQAKAKKLMHDYFIAYDKEPSKAEAGLPTNDCTIM